MGVCQDAQSCRVHIYAGGYLYIPQASLIGWSHASIYNWDVEYGGQSGVARYGVRGTYKWHASYLMSADCLVGREDRRSRNLRCV